MDGTTAAAPLPPPDRADEPIVEKRPRYIAERSRSRSRNRDRDDGHGRDADRRRGDGDRESYRDGRGGGSRDVDSTGPQAQAQSYGYGGGSSSNSGPGRERGGGYTYNNGGYGRRDQYDRGGRDYHDRGGRDSYDRGGRDYHDRGGGSRDHGGRGSSSSRGGGGGDAGAYAAAASAGPRRTKEEEEVHQLTRDARTIFVGQLVVRAVERDVREYFEQVGAVADVQLIKDKASGKSKGFGYIEFADLESVPKALLLNGQKFCMKHPACACSGFPILVKPSESEKNYAALAEAAGGSVLSAQNERRVYLGDVAAAVTEGDLREIAALFGALDKVQVIRDDRGHSRGVAVITFSTADAAAKAAATLHGMEMGGARLKAGALNALGEVATPDGGRFSLDAGSGHALSAQARAALSQQLAGATSSAAQALGSTLLAATAGGAAGGGSAGAGGGGGIIPGITPSAGSALMPGVLGPVGSIPATTVLPTSVLAQTGASGGGTAMAPPRGVPTPCVLLKNMFHPARETRPDWDREIARDVEGECARFGPVVHVRVIRDSPGFVHVMFADVGSAVTAATSFSGRIFGGSAIAVEFVPLADYVSRYPEVASRV